MINFCFWFGQSEWGQCEPTKWFVVVVFVSVFAFLKKPHIFIQQLRNNNNSSNHNNNSISNPSWKNRVDSLLFVLCLRAQNSTAKACTSKSWYFSLSLSLPCSPLLIFQMCYFCVAVAVTVAYLPLLLPFLYSIDCVQFCCVYYFFRFSLRFYTIARHT